MKLPRFLSRALARLGYEKRSTVFAGAQGNRLTLDWFASILSADQEVKSNLRVLRARAREMARNSPTAKSYLNLLSSNVVGSDGITYQSRVRNNNGKLASALNEKIEEAWQEWCKPENCSVDGKLSFRGIQDLVLRDTAQDGEMFVRLVRGFPGSKYRFALQLIDPDQVDHLYSREKVKSENEIRCSVEVDDWGRPVAYWITPRYPYDLQGTLERHREPAESIVHLFDPYRVNQTRGLTWFHNVMFPLRMLDGYFEAELVAARTGAAKMGFLKYNDAATYEAPDPNAKIVMDANPGTIEQLPPGMDFTSWAPDHPSGAFPAFVQAILRQVATGLGVSYNALANDLVGVNYSSIRSGLLVERDQWRRHQSWFIESFLQRVFDAWLPIALLSGELVLDSRDPTKFSAGKWEPRGWQWVDPLKDVQASILAIGAGLTSRTEVISEKGGDFEETIEQLAEENELAAQYNVDLVTSTQKPTGGAPAAEDGSAGTGAQEEGASAGDGSSGDGTGDRGIVPALVARIPRINGKELTQ